MPRTTLAANDMPNNTGRFLNDLFQDTVRAPATFVAKIQQSITAGSGIAWLISTAERDLMVSKLAEVIIRGGGPQLSPEDRALMKFFHRYIKANALAMSVPDVTQTGAGPPVSYRLDGYSKYVLYDGNRRGRKNSAFHEGNVRYFLELFLAGAHFVVLHSQRDFCGGTQDFYREFGNEFYSWSGSWTGARAGAAVGHSHYGNALTNFRSAYAYPNIWENLGVKASQRWPLVPIMIVDRTASRDHNTFFQMEGWSTSLLGSFLQWHATIAAVDVGRRALLSYLFPAGLPLTLFTAVTSVLAQIDALGSSRVQKGGERHGADFDTHQDSKWNISTYGASVYSEKRGTTVFLHKVSRTMARSGNTIMAEYVGGQRPPATLLT